MLFLLLLLLGTVQGDIVRPRTTSPVHLATKLVVTRLQVRQVVSTAVVSRQELAQVLHHTLQAQQVTRAHTRVETAPRAMSSQHHHNLHHETHTSNRAQVDTSPGMQEVAPEGVGSMAAVGVITRVVPEGMVVKEGEEEMIVAAMAVTEDTMEETEGMYKLSFFSVQVFGLLKMSIFEM